MVKAVITAPGATPVTATLENGAYIIGASSSCHIPIQVTGISRRHAQLIVSDGRITVMDLGAAYENLTKYERTVALDEDGVTVTDLIEADHPVTVTYPLHTLAAPQADGACITVARDNCTMHIEVLEGDLRLDSITDRYAVDLNDGEPEAYRVTMPQQYHIYYRAEAATHHLFRVRFSVTHT